MTFHCKLPWQAVQINETGFSPCCNFTWQKTPRTFDEYKNSQELQETRESLLKNQAPTQCGKCVLQEKLSGYSYRTISNTFENEDPENEFEHVTILTSNVCNLKCTSCNGSNSYARGVELSQLGIGHRMPPQLDSTFVYESVAQHPIKTLTLLGGEPFVDSTKKLLDRLIANQTSQQIDLRLNSNCTMITHEWLQYLVKNFRSIQIKISLDGVGTVNNYLRYPSDWDSIVQGINLIQLYPKITTVITAVLSNLSLLRLHELIEWCVQANHHDLFLSVVHTPFEMIPSALPADVKQSLLHTYNQLLEKYQNFSPRIDLAIRGCIEVCQKHKDQDQKNFERALCWFLLHDQHRQQNLFTVFPELHSYKAQ